MKWYRQAADGGDKRAAKRLASSNRTGVSALDRRLEMEAMKEDHGVKGAKGDNCVIM
jgi:TPR repeat protein